MTLRSRFVDGSGLLIPLGPERVIFCVWHNRLALSMFINRTVLQGQDSKRRLAALISASRDGAFLSCILERFGVEPVRGSSSRRGAQALLELTTAARDGCDLAITPDGPRGPCYTVQSGVITLAQITGLPIVPTAYDLDWKVRANSWDRFQLPLPFSRCVIRFGEAIRVPPGSSDAERAALREQLEATLRAITHD